MTTAPSRASSKNRGFTLTEIAIVIGIIGLMMSAIWLAAGSVSTSNKVNTAITEIMTISQGMQALYAQQAGTGDGDGTNEITLGATLLSTGIFPSNMNDGIVAFTPWSSSGGCATYGGTGCVFLTSQSATTAETGDAFAIEYQDIPSSACASIISGVMQSSSIVFAQVSTTHIGAAALTGQPYIVPPTATTLTGGCTGSSTVNIQFVFKLHG